MRVRRRLAQRATTGAAILNLRGIDFTKRRAWVAKITPPIAQQLIENFNTRNRDKSQRVIDRYCRAMRHRKWWFTNNAIGFDYQGVLVDAQHRLLALIDSGISMDFVIVTGLPLEARSVIDEGHARTPVDAGKLGPHQLSLTKYEVGTSRAMYESFSGRDRIKLNNQDIVEFYLRHQEAIKFVTAVLPPGTGPAARATVRGALARMFESTGNRQRCAEYANVLKTGEHNGPPGGPDSAAIVFRNYLLDKHVQNMTGRVINSEVYRRALTAQDYFLREKPLSKRQLQPASQELYAIPEDKWKAVRTKLSKKKEATSGKEKGSSPAAA